MSFLDRVSTLPHLGLGISTEYGAACAGGSLDPLALHRASGGDVAFLEVGVEVSKGLDADADRWLDAGLPCTYHYLDLNLDQPRDFDPEWVAAVQHLVQQIKPAWLCGDAGLWHFGPREPAHMLLLPPILTDEAATAIAQGIIRLREATGCEVLPENPPGRAYVGDLHLLDFYARVCERADTGLLLDCAHLAIYQRLQGHAACEGLDHFPVERIVEIHVAGGTEGSWDGFAYVEDDHQLTILPDTWEILDSVAKRAPNLRAVVLECERNPLEEAAPAFRKLQDRLAPTPFGQAKRSAS